MNEQEIRQIIEKQQQFFASGATLSVEARLQALKKLKAAIISQEDQIHDALRQDLGKSGMESYMCETGMVLSELSHMIRHLPRYARERRVRTPLAQYVSRSYRKPSPYGTVLIMSPWNYPFMLTIDPLVDALAAGNTALVKPSAYSPATSLVIQQLITQCFPQEYVAVVQGGREENQFLLSQKFDYIFFTGSQAVGKEVLRRAAEHLTPVTLELGGKSPCIVDETANLKRAAARIVFGKFLNLGQTCVAPDYLFVQESVKDKLLEEIRRFIRKQLGENPLENENYGKIINEKHFNRLLGLMESGKIYLGGESRRDTLQIAPTVLTDVRPSDPVMQEEIFGPILPVLTFRDIREVITFVRHREKPLALYLFTRSQKTEQQVLLNVSFGGGCVNDTIIHLATSRMGFGGVGQSGMGSYHGKRSFQTFSHERSIVKKYNWLDLPIRYQPYNGWKEFLLRMFLR